MQPDNWKLSAESLQPRDTPRQSLLLCFPLHSVRCIVAEFMRSSTRRIKTDIYNTLHHNSHASTMFLTIKPSTWTPYRNTSPNQSSIAAVYQPVIDIVAP